MTMHGTGEPLARTLLAQSGWARRLARQLVNDDEQAEDLVQDALVAGLRAAPSGDRPIRAWLATVLRHLAYNQAAARARRRAREQRSAEGDASAPSAEEALAQVQIHHQLARLVERLPAEERRIVVLRYFEERTSVDIGKLLGCPAATVRWRLTRALEQLRAWLDEEAGGARARWALALAPLAEERRPGAPEWLGGRPLVKLLGVTAAAVTMLAVGAGVVTGKIGGKAEPSVAAALDGSRAAAPGGGHGGPQPPPSAPAAPPPAGAASGGARLAAMAAASSCPAQLAAARAELEATERDLQRYENPALYFERAPPSPALQADFTTLVAELLAPAAGGVLECREGICRVLFVLPADVEWRPVRSGLLDGPWHRRIEPRLARVDAGKVGGITRDPLSGELQQKWALYLCLARLDGRPAHDEVPPGPPPPGADCERHLAAARARLEALRPRRERALPAHVQFERQPGPNPPATASVRALLERLLGPRARAWEVACRADVCRLKPPKEEPAASLHELQQRPELALRLGRSWRGPDGAHYHRLRPPPAASEDELAHDETWRRLERAVDVAIKLCGERHGSAERAEAIILFPAPGELNADGAPGRPSLRVRGPRADQAFGQCLRQGITAALASVPLPPGLPGREVTLSLHGTRPAP
jgi:RNA polymerase sigma-70 factor, ECF subfamily